MIKGAPPYSRPEDRRINLHTGMTVVKEGPEKSGRGQWVGCVVIADNHGLVANPGSIHDLRELRRRSNIKNLLKQGIDEICEAIDIHRTRNMPFEVVSPAVFPYL